MKKEQKKEVVAELTEELKGAEAIFAIDYRGISVPQAAELRSGLREADTRFRIVKNRLTLLAAEQAGTEELKNHLSGPTALALVDGDVALAAKTISRLGGDWELLDYKGGIMNGEALEPDSFKTIARLPGREQLNAQFAGIVASPLTGLVRGLGSMIQGLASQLQQIADKGLVSGEAPPETSEEEPPKEVAAPAAADAETASDYEGGGGEDAASDADGSGDGEAPAEPQAQEKSEPDPAPQESPEESSEEEAPEGEEGGPEQVEETTEGDAEVGQAQEAAETSETETSEDSDENKEDGE